VAILQVHIRATDIGVAQHIPQILLKFVCILLKCSKTDCFQIWVAVMILSQYLPQYNYYTIQ